LGAVLNDRAAAIEGDRRRDAQLFGKYGKFVGAAIAIGVFADANLVATFSHGLQFIGVVVGLADPKAPALIPSHVDRLAFELRLSNEELDFEAGRCEKVLHRLFDGQRLLHLVPLAIAAGAPSRRIERNLGLGEFEWGSVGAFGGQWRLIIRAEDVL